MGAAEAFQAGGPDLLLVVIAAGIIGYLLRKVDKLERRDEERTKAAFDLLMKREERDQERLKLYEEKERREREALR